MIIKVLGSSSHGNGYVLQSSTGNSLILEAGVPYNDVLRAVGYKSVSIMACLVSHEHADHAKFFHEYDHYGTRIYGSPAMKRYLPEKQLTPFGDFSVLPFRVHHDVPNYGYVISHPEIGTLLFATDCAHIPTAFRGIDHFLIEANYSIDTLLLSDTEDRQKKRIMESHQSLEDCMDYLTLCRAHTAKSITLIHLSSRHSDPQRFTSAIQAEFGVPCNIARKGTVITL